MLAGLLLGVASATLSGLAIRRHVQLERRIKKVEEEAEARAAEEEIPTPQTDFGNQDI